MEKLTAMQELISKLQDSKKRIADRWNYPTGEKVSIAIEAINKALDQSILFATELLEKEKQQHYDTFVAGSKRGEGEMPFNAEQYYSQTFKQQ